MPSAWSPENWLYSAVSVEADNEAPTLPASRLLIPRVARRYRARNLADGATKVRVRIDFGAARPIDRIVWRRLREPLHIERTPGWPVLAASDPVRHRLSNDEAFLETPEAAALVYDSGWTPSNIAPGWGYHDHIVPPEGGVVRTARYADFQFDALSRAAAPNNYVDWGTAWYAQMRSVDIGFAAPFSIKPASNTTTRQGAFDEGEDINPGKVWLNFEVIFRAIKEVERPDVLDFLVETESFARFLFVVDKAVADPRGVMIARNLTPGLDKTSRAFGRLAMRLKESV